jgi:16S rRNA (adenine1518-N6/adenine1519-N6)-dimethyltransferase
LRRHGLRARKPWGQHFLHEPAILDRIVAASGAGSASRVIEIGAGLGGLTARLLAAGAEVWAIERDRDLCEVVRRELGAHPRLRLFEADAVGFDYGSAAVGGAAPIVVGNLPYQLTGPLLFALLEHHACTAAWVIMVQREVAERLCAGPGSRTYGVPTVLLSRVRAITRVCTVGRGSFVPAPRVDSAVLRLDPLERPRGEVGDPERLRVLVRTVFRRRRKTIVNGLSGLTDRAQARAWCERAGIDPRARPEQLAPEQFAALERARSETPHA